MKKHIPLVKPFLPPLEKYVEGLKELWESKFLTNMGKFHEQYRKDVAKYLGVDYAYPFVNGTIALETAIKMLGIKGKKIITTPFTFVATTLAILNTGNIPIFCDVDDRGNLDINKFPKDKLDSDVAAIIPVHLYGEPCDVDDIELFAKENNLFVIYDAAHVFGLYLNIRGIGSYGDISIFSTHSTKLFHTIEGGLLTFNNPEFERISRLFSNFGLNEMYNSMFQGSNGKMNEFQSLMGILQLDYIDDLINKRMKVVENYKKLLDDSLIFTKYDSKNITYSYSYFIIRHEKRDEIFIELMRNNITSRKYFYPLVSDYNLVKESGIIVSDIDNARVISSEVLAIPMFSELKLSEQKKICKIINSVLDK